MEPSKKAQNLARFSYFSLLAAWILGFQVFLFKLAGKGILLLYRNGQDCHFTDFVIFYSWWRIAASSFKDKLYDPLVQMKFFSELLGPMTQQQLPFKQATPYFFVCFAPLSQLSLGQAFVAWNLLCNGLFLLSLWLCLGVCGSFDRKFKSLFILACCGSFPFLACEREGQTGALMAAIFGFFSYFLLKKRDFASGFCLSLFLLKPQYLPFVFIIPLAYRRFKLLSSFLISSLVLSLLAISWIGIPAFLDYPKVLLGVEANAGVYHSIFSEWMVSLRGAFTYFMSEKAAMLLSLLLTAVSMLGAFVLALKARSSQSEKLDSLLLSLIVMIAVVFSPHTYVYDLHLLCVAAACGWQAVSAGGEARLKKLWRAVFISYPIMGMVFFIIMDRLQDGRLFLPFHLLPDLLLLYCTLKIFLTESSGTRLVSD